ncbi:hypothetical protein V8J82_06790 [Gymnodinialimonas sp. 2305UL16-5]|uniref:hypothetical protein n=1 Tax=Gymnodinialimonas mytili TaxID=3126503 RepID=UPI0030B596ED
MTLKNTLLSTAAILALAMPAIAQSTSGETDVEVETPLLDADVTAESETDTEVETPVLDTDIATDSELETGAETELATEVTMGDRDLRDTAIFAGMTVSEIVGMDVHAMGADGEADVGEIDYIIETADGYEAVIGIGGFLGLGEYTVALPLGAFSMGDAENQLMLDGYTEAELEAMPEIDESELEALDGEYVIS